MPATLTANPKGIPTADEAFAYCAELTRQHYENFPVASLFLPEEKRPYIQSIYAFSRIADDFADESDRSPADRLKLLGEWEEMLIQCYEGEAEHPVFIALGETVRKNAIPMQYLEALLSAFKQDVVKHRYQDFHELLDYCSRSANPVGRIVLSIFGVRDEEIFALSDSICTGLQLANFWQDVAVDLEKDRVYLPLADMDTFGYSLADLENRTLNEKFKPLMKFQIDRTREFFYKGVRLPERVDPDLGLELRLVWLGGMTVLRMIESADCDVFSERLTLTMHEKISILLRGLMMKDISRFGRTRGKTGGR